MTTLLDIVLKVSKEVQDVLESTATGGSITTLADSVMLGTFPDDHFNKGFLAIKSGTQAGKMLLITDFAATTGVCTFASLGGTNTIAAGAKYAITRATFPYDQIVSAIERALDKTWVTDVDSTLYGDGTSLDFDLPTGVSSVIRVEFYDGEKYSPSHHWRETHDGHLRFDYGYAPYDGDQIFIYFHTAHAELTDYTVDINNEIDPEWLKWAAAEELLWWGIGLYGQQVEYRIEERMNKVMSNLKGKSPHKRPIIITHTSGG